MKIISFDSPDTLELRDDKTILDDAYDWYVETFKDIDTMAVQRHLMEFDEFAHTWFNFLIDKHLVLDDAGKIVGMSVITNMLDQWPLISPRYFQTHFEDMFDRKAIWYIGFVGARSADQKQDVNTFRELVATMLPAVVESRGMAVMDFCHYNSMKRKLPHITYLMLDRMNEDVQSAKLDQQEFWGYRFDGKGYPTTGTITGVSI